MDELGCSCTNSAAVHISDVCWSFMPFPQQSRMAGLLTQLQGLTGLNHIAGDPSWHQRHIANIDTPPQMPADRTLKYVQDVNQRRERDLIECKNALEGFKSTNEQEAETYYTAQIKNNPQTYEYVQILEKLHAIFALPGKLDSFIKTHTPAQAENIKVDCRTILRMHEKADFDPLFKTCSYSNSQGVQFKPKYGKWTYDAKEYEMEKMIKEVQVMMR